MEASSSSSSGVKSLGLRMASSSAYRMAEWVLREIRSAG
jgi:hypothetical protein